MALFLPYSTDTAQEVATAKRVSAETIKAAQEATTLHDARPDLLARLVNSI